VKPASSKLFRKKPHGSERASDRAPVRVRRASELVAAAGLLAAIGRPALAGPEGAQVSHGSASFARSGSLTTITASDNAIINYKSFDIRSGEAVRFVQPSSRSRVLNRIESPVPTRIDGSLSSNGIVYLLNPSGVLFGNGAKIDVAGITAAAARMSDSDFIKGFDRFTDVSGAVINQGSIKSGSTVNLIGNYVANSGTIEAKDAVVMAVGDEVLVAENPLSGTYVRVSAKPPAEEAGPRTDKPAGKPRPSLAAGDLFSLAISQTGTVKSAHVRAESARAGRVQIAGKIDASSATGKGGKVEVLGSTVKLEGANIDVSGRDGGGSVRVGGDLQGKGELRHAGVTTADAATSIKADATARGDGGSVVLWSDQLTSSRATISAQGGSQGGDGGFAEISSKSTLDFSVGPADLRAARGRQGTLLLDPTNVQIIDGVAGSGDQDNVLFVNSGFLSAGAADTAFNTVSWGQIASLSGPTSNIIIQATNQITFGNITGATPGVTSADGTAAVGRLTGQTLRFEAQGGSISFADSSDRVLVTGGGTLELIAGTSISAARLESTTGTIKLTSGTTMSLRSMVADSIVLSAGNSTPGSAVSQAAPFSTTNLTLLGSADYQFGAQANNLVTLAGSFTGTGAQVSIQDLSGFSVGTVGAVSGLSIGTAATNRFLLQTDGAVTQTDPIVAGQFRVLGNGSVSFTSAGNDFGTIAGLLTGASSSIFIRDDNGLVVGNAGGIPGVGIGTLAANILSIQSDGPITQTHALVCGSLRFTGAGSATFGTLNNETVTLAAKLTGPSSSLTFRDDNGFAVGTISGTAGVDVGTGASNTLSIQSNSGVTQSQPIIAGNLRLLGSGAFSLLGQSNNTDVLAASLTGTSTVLEFRDDTGFSIGSVLGTNGVSVASDPSNRISFQSGSLVSQTQPLSASSLRMLGTGSYDFSNAGNALSVIAGSLSSPTSFITVRSTGGITVGTVSTTSGVNIGSTAANQLRLISDVSMLQTTPIVAGVLELTGAGSATLINPANDVATFAANLSGGSSTLAYADTNNFSIGVGPTVSGITLPTGSGNILLIGSAGTTTQTAPIVSGPFVMVGGGSLVLDTQNNSVSSLAIGMTGANSSVSFRQDSGISIDSALGIFGASTFTGANNTLTFRSDGVITQSQPVVTTGLRLLGAGLANLTSGGNRITTLAASMTGATSALAYSQVNPIVIGAVGGTSGVNIGTGAGNLFLLTSSGAITQTQPVVAGAITLSGSGSATLTNAGNTFSGLTFASLGGPSTIFTNPASGQLLVNTSSVGGTASITSAGDLRVGGVFTTGTSLSLQAGSDGSGNLTFAAGSGLRADTIALRAGDGPGGASAATIDAGTNAPTIANGAGTANPTSLSLRADGAIDSAQIPAAAQFNAGNTTGLTYTILSDQGAVTVADGTKLAAAVLSINGSAVNISDNVSVRSFTTSSPVVLSGNTELASTQANLTLGSTLAIGSGNVTLTSDEVDLGGNVSGAGSLTIRPFTSSVGVALGGTETPGRLDLTAAELARLQAGLAALTLGNSSGTGTLLTLSDTSFKAPTTFRGPGGITLSANVRSQGFKLTFANPVRLTIDTQVASNDNGVLTGADIEFLDTIDAQAAGVQALAIFPGSTGVARLGGPAFDKPVGGLAAIKSMSISGGGLAIGAVSSTGFQDYIGPADVRGNLTSQFSSIRLASPVTTTGSRIFSAATTYAHQSGLTAGGNLSISAGSDATFGGTTAVTGSLSAIVTGNLTATGATTSTGTMSLTSGGNIAVTSLGAGSSLGVTSVGSTTATGNATSTGTININAGTTLAMAGVNAGTGLTAQATGSATFSGPVAAGTFGNIDAASILASGTVSSGTTLSLSGDTTVQVNQGVTTGGTTSITAPTSATFAAINSGGSLTFNSGVTSVSGAIQSTGPIQFTVSSLSTAGITGQSSLVANATGPITIGGNTTLTGTGALTAGSTITLAGFAAGPGLTMAAPGLVRFNGAVSSTGALGANVGSLVANSTIGSGTTLGITSAGAVDLNGAVNAGSTLNISGTSIDAAGTLSSVGSTTLDSSGRMSLAAINAGAATSLTAVGPISYTSLTSGGNLAASGAGIIGTLTTNVTGAATMNSTAALSLGGAFSSTGLASLTSGTNMSLASVTSGGTTGLSAGGTLSYASVQSAGNLNATGVGITGTSTTNVTGGSATIHSTAGLTLGGGLSASTGATLTSTGAMTLTSVNSGGATGLTAGGTLSYTSLISGGNLNASGAGITGTSTTNVTAGSATMNSSAGLTLGGALTTTGTTSLTSAGPMSLASVNSGGATGLAAGGALSYTSLTSGGNLNASGAGITGTGATNLTGSATYNSGAALSLAGDLAASGPVSLTSTLGATLAGVSAGSGFNATTGGFSAGAITTTGPATIDSGAGVTLTGTLSAGGAVTIASDGSSSLRAITTPSSIALNSGNDLTLLGALNSGSTISALANGAVAIGASAKAPTSISFRSGEDGTGDLTFTAGGLTIDTPTLTLRAGDGPGGVKTAFVNALAGSPSFRGFAGAGTSPTSFTHQQDASIVDAQTAAGSQFAGGLGSVQYRLISDDGSITIADPSKFLGTDLTVRSAAGFSAVPFAPAKLTIEGPLSSGNQTIDIGAGTLTLSDALTLGASDLTIYADEINILAPISGSGTLTLGPGTLARPVLLAGATDSGSGRLDLTAGELDFLLDGFAAIVVGRSNSTGTLGFAAPRTFSDPMVFRAAGVITADRALTGIGDGAFRFESTQPVRLGTTITTQGQDVAFAAPVRLTGDTSLSVNGGDVGFDQALDAVSDGVGNLQISTGSGQTAFLAPVGSTFRPNSINVPGEVNAGSMRVVDGLTLGDLSLNANAVYAGRTLTFASVRAPGSSSSFRATPTGAGASVNFPGGIGAPGQTPTSITVDAGGTAQLFGAIRAGGPVLFSSPANFHDGTSIDASNAAVTFAQALTGEGNLTVNAGTGPTNFQGVTTTNPNGASLTLLSAGLTTFNAPTSLASGVFAAGPVRIAGNMTITGADAPTTFNNSVELAGVGLESAGDITLGFSSVHTLNPSGDSTVRSTGGNVRVPALIDGPGALTLKANLGAVTLEQALGSNVAPASLNVSASQIAMQGARTVGFMLIQGPTTLNGNLTTSGAPITINQPVILATDVTIDSTAGGAASGASITIAGSVDSDAVAPRGLSVVAGSGVGDLQQGVGQGRALSGLTVAASSYDLPAVRTTGPQSHLGVKRLHGDLSVINAGSITLGDTTTLVSNVALITPGAATDLVRVTGTLDDSAVGVHTLSVNAGASQALFEGNVGTITAPRNVSVVAGVTQFNKLTQTDSFNITGPVSILDDMTSLAGDMTFGAPVTIARDLTLKAQNITFNDIVSGDSGPILHDVVLDAPGLTSLNADFGALRPFQSVRMIGGGSTRIAGSRVTAVGEQTYDEPVVLAADTHIAGSSLRFNSTIDSDGTPRSLNLDTDQAGTATLGGNIGSISKLASLRIGAAPLSAPGRFTSLGNPLENNAGTILGGNVSTTGDITIGGPLTLTSDAVVRSDNGDVLFRSSVNSDATPRSLAVLTNRDTTGTQPTLPLIKFNGPVGQSSPLANLWLNYLPAAFNGGTLIDGREQVPAVSTVLLANQLDADGNLPASANTSTTLPVTVAGDIIFGHREKLLSIGTANLTATTGKIAVGDITTMADANLVAGSAIEFRLREVGSVLDVVGVSVPDLGLDFVSAGVINFSRPPSLTDAGPEPTFANPTGERGDNSSGYAFRIFTGGIDMTRLAPPNSSAAKILDLRSLGPSDTNVAQAIAGAIPTSDTGSVTTEVTVGAGLRDQLAEIGIFVKDLLPEDVLQMLAGRALYNDVPSSGQRSLTAGGNPFADPTLGEYRVSVNRLPTRSVVDVLSAYQALAYRITKDDAGKIVREDLRPAIRDQLLEAWRAFAQAESGGKRIRLDARKFRVYLESRGSERTEAEFQSLATLEQIKEILARLRAMGLSPVEYQISRNAILAGIAPDQIGTAALGDAAEYDTSSNAVSANIGPQSSPGASPEDAPKSDDQATPESKPQPTSEPNSEPKSEPKADLEPAGADAPKGF